MSDSPYSLKSWADRFRAAGFTVLNMRMPGHGTAPVELAGVSWQDWSAAVEIAAEGLMGDDAARPFIIMGYSNGGSLALKYTLDAIETGSNPVPDRLILISPMLGVSPLSRFGSIYYWLANCPFFKRHCGSIFTLNTIPISTTLSR